MIVSDGRGEAALWAAVAQAGIEDALSGRDAGWIATPDAATVFSLAGVDPDAVQARLPHLSLPDRRGNRGRKPGC